MLISKTSESKEIVDKFIHDLQMAERLEAAAKSLNESGCNLYRRMIIRVFCDPDKKRKVEVDFGNGGLLFGENPLFEELPALATLLEKNLERVIRVGCKKDKLEWRVLSVWREALRMISIIFFLSYWDMLKSRK